MSNEECIVLYILIIPYDSIMQSLPFATFGTKEIVLMAFYMVFNGEARPCIEK